MHCHACQQNKPSTQRPPGLLQPLDVPTGRWQRVSMEFITHLPVLAEGFDAAFVCGDYLTKMLVVRSTRTVADAPDVTRLFIDSVV